jgi:hypothetical protein
MYTVTVTMLGSDYLMATHTYYYGGGYHFIYKINANYTLTQGYVTGNMAIPAPVYFSDVKYLKTGYVIQVSTNGTNGYITVLSYTVPPSYSVVNLAQTTKSGLSGYNSLEIIDDEHVIWAYSGVGDDGYIVTYAIDTIARTVTIIGSSLEHDTSCGIWNSLVKITNTIYALAYTGNGNINYLKTFSLDGSFVPTQLDVIQIDTYGTYNKIERIDNNHVMVVYTGNSNRVMIKTYYFDNNGDNIAVCKSLEHALYGAHYALCQIDSLNYALAFSSNTAQEIKILSLDIADDFNLEAKEGTLEGGFTPELIITST